MLKTNELIADHESSPRKQNVTGKWFEIRLSPDLVSGEILNIGVGFIRARTHEFSFRLLESSAPFGCLYGPRGREQFGFLLGVAREAFASHGASAKISPHLSFGEARSVQGESVEQILGDLYQMTVTLARRAAQLDDLLTPAERRAPKSTETLRKRVRRAFKATYDKKLSTVWRDTPVAVTADDIRHSIDMQIWVEESLLNPRCFGSIVSVCYNNGHYRKGFLTGAYHSLTIARAEMDAKGKGGIFILRPEHGEYSDHTIHDEIDNEIDNATWVLQRKFNITPYVTEKLDELKAKALSFAE